MWRTPTVAGTHTHVQCICSSKDTGQRVDCALNGFQHGPLGGHVLLGRHGNAKHIKKREREKKKKRRGIKVLKIEVEQQQ